MKANGMKKIVLFILGILLTAPSHECFAWGRNGHATITYIAERHLTPQAKANIEKCLDGGSMVYYSSWLDYHRDEHKVWKRLRHTFDIDIATGKPAGRPIKQLRSSLKKLHNYQELPDSTLKLSLYYFLHAFGDFHCPGHIQHVDYTGEKPKIVKYTDYDVYYAPRKKRIQYHKLWDTPVLSHNHTDWGYMDWGHALDSGVSQEYIDHVTAGTLEDWFTEAASSTVRIYSDIPRSPKGAKDEELPVVTLNLMNEYGDLAAEQMLKAGLRMAKLINEIFGE